MTTPRDDISGLSERLRRTLPGIAQEETGGDNLAILLASYFEPGIEDDMLDDSGTWKQGAIDACDRVLDAIHAHYATAIDALQARVKELEATLRQHHDWHLQAGSIGLQDGDGGWIEIDNAAEYSDSAMYERTEKLLAGAPPEELQPMPRGGMNTWWWEQAVLLRRKFRAAESRTIRAEQRVKELEAQLAVADATLLRLNSGQELQSLMRLNNDLEARATRAEKRVKEYDAAYDGLMKE